MLNYYPKAFIKYGIDPCDIAKEITGDITVIQDSFPSAELNSELNEASVDIIPVSSDIFPGKIYSVTSRHCGDFTDTSIEDIHDIKVFICQVWLLAYCSQKGKRWKTACCLSATVSD